MNRIERVRSYGQVAARRMPWCAVCRREVDEVVATPNPERLSVDFTVHCHGASERCELPDKMVHAGEVHFGVAFGAEAQAKTPELGARSLELER